MILANCSWLRPPFLSGHTSGDQKYISKWIICGSCVTSLVMPSAFSVMVGLLPEPQTLCLPVDLNERLELEWRSDPCRQLLAWQYMSSKCMQIQESCFLWLMTLELLPHLNQVLILVSLRTESEMGVESSPGFLFERIIVGLRMEPTPFTRPHEKPLF